MAAPVNAFDAWMMAHGQVVFGGVGWTLCLIIIGANAVSLQEGFRGLRIAREAPNWPTVPGVITRSELDKTVSGRSGIESFAPGIRYRYEAYGKQHESDRVMTVIFDAIFDKPNAQAWLDVYPLGAAVAVYVSPANPRESVLRPSEPSAIPTCRTRISWGWAGVVFGLAMLAFTICNIWPGYLLKPG